MNRIAHSIVNLMLIIAVSAGLTACKDEERDHKLTVTVVADGDVLVANALVRLYAPVENSFIDWYDYTNEMGELNYSFENTVVVEIEATKGSFKGCSFIRVEPGQNNKTVEVKPYGSDDNGCTSSSP